MSWCSCRIRIVGLVSLLYMCHPVFPAPLTREAVFIQHVPGVFVTWLWLCGFSSDSSLPSVCVPVSAGAPVLCSHGSCSTIWDQVLVMTPQHCFILRIALDMWGLMWFRMNIRIFFLFLWRMSLTFWLGTIKCISLIQYQNCFHYINSANPWAQASFLLSLRPFLHVLKYPL